MEKDQIVSQLHKALVAYDKIYDVLSEYDSTKLVKSRLFCRAKVFEEDFYDKFYGFMQKYVKPLGKDEAREVCNEVIELFRRDRPNSEHTPDEWVETIFWDFFDENLDENLANE